MSFKRAHVLCKKKEKNPLVESCGGCHPIAVNLTGESVRPDVICQVRFFLSYSTFQNIFERLILLFLSDYTKVLFLLCACNTFWWSIWINMIEIEILFIVMLSQYIIKKNITLYHKVYNQNVSGYFDINTMKMLFILSSEIIVEMRNLWNICLSHLVNKLTKTELCHRLKSHYHNEAHIDPEPMRRK